MKVKSFSPLFLTLAILAVGTSPTTDDETINKLEPFVYEKLKFDQNTDYLHDKKKIEMKNTIPVKQFDILFDGSRKLPEQRDASFLFRESAQNVTSTVAVKSSEIGLFAEKKVHLKIETPHNSIAEQAKGNGLRTVIYIGLITICLLILFIYFLPRLLNESTMEVKKVYRK